MQSDVWSKEDEEALQKESVAKAAGEAEAYLAMEPQPAVSMFDFLYETLPNALAEQRREVLNTP